MKGKIFVLFIMVGIPTITWAFLAWVVMLALGALHSLYSAIPSLSFLESFLATLMLFAIVIFALSMATLSAYFGGPFPLRRPLGRLAEHARSA